MQASEILSTTSVKNFQNFLNRASRRSESTKHLYAWGITLLTVFLRKAHPDMTIPLLKKADQYELLDAYAGWLMEQGFGSNSVISAITTAKKWMWYHDVEVYREKLRQKVELPRPEEAADDAPTKEEIRKILSTMEFETQNRLLMIACSGIRPVDLQYLKWSDFKWEERPVRLIVPPYGKTKRGWETFITDELAERLKNQQRLENSELLWPTSGSVSTSVSFITAIRHHKDLNIVSKTSQRGREFSRHKYHLYSLKKFFHSNVTAEVGDEIAKAWEGRKAYLATYNRLRLEEKRQLYLKVMPRLAIFQTEAPKTQDRLRERLKRRGLTDENIDRVLEGLVLN